MPGLAGSLLPVLPQIEFQPLAVLRGLGLGLGIALLFALPPLLAALRVPAARVLRREVEPLPPSRLVLAATGIAPARGVDASSPRCRPGRSPWVRPSPAASRRPRCVLALGARGLIVLVRRLPRLALPLPLRYGLAALGRPGGADRRERRRPRPRRAGRGRHAHRRDRPHRRGCGRISRPNAPTAFLIDIQPDQWAAVRAEIERAGATSVDSVPVVMARLAEIDGEPVAALAAAREKQRDSAAKADEDGDEERGQRGRWALTREQRLTFLDKLPADNTLLEGKLWGTPGGRRGERRGGVRARPRPPKSARRSSSTSRACRSS